MKILEYTIDTDTNIWDIDVRYIKNHYTIPMYEITWFSRRNCSPYMTLIDGHADYDQICEFIAKGAENLLQNEEIYYNNSIPEAPLLEVAEYDEGIQNGQAFPIFSGERSTKYPRTFRGKTMRKVQEAFSRMRARRF